MADTVLGMTTGHTSNSPVIEENAGIERLAGTALPGLITARNGPLAGDQLPKNLPRESAPRGDAAKGRRVEAERSQKTGGASLLQEPERSGDSRRQTAEGNAAFAGIVMVCNF